MADTGTYVYAVGRGLDEGRIRELTGLRDARLRVLAHRGLVAIVSTVDLDEFGESGLRQHLEDIRWLEDVARRHDEVVRRAAAATMVLAPFRLATIYRSDQGVYERIDQAYDDLVRALDRIEGCSEWSVKAFAKEQSAAGGAPAASGPGAGAGVAYLERRRAEIAQTEALAARVAEEADHLFRELAAGADAARRLAPQDQSLDGRTRPMALNGTFLVADELATVFFGLFDDARKRYSTVEIELDGPWPPYSFATLDAP